MNRESLLRNVLRPAALLAVLGAAGVVALASCATSSTPSGSASAAVPFTWPAPPNPDPRVGLRPGLTDAGEAAWNLRRLSTSPPSADFVGVTNSDLAFRGNHVFQGNYNGFQVWDVTNPQRPTLALAYLCPASQSDVSVYNNLLFVSAEGQSGRGDCGTQGVEGSVSPDRVRGIRILDISNISSPRYITNVQTCRGSHTHTVVTDLDDRQNVYIYVSGSSGVRSPDELPGCSDGSMDENPETARFRLEVIRVPLANPAAAAIVSSPRVFTGLAAPPRRGAGERGGAGGGRGGRGGGGRGASGPNQCHDITVYPAIDRAGGACNGYGLLLDISDVTNPRRITAVADSNFSLWHSATFSNDGSKMLFSDEWGGGGSPRCRETDGRQWGANAIFTIDNDRLTFRSYYKLPAPQTDLENCVAHNGSLIPIPGREVMVQGWYQGGISVFDWTDPDNAFEIAFHDRGPISGEELVSGGSWSVYWYNGYLYNSEMKRGLDIFELQPSGFLTQNEIDAANTVRLEQLNAQEQPKFVWPPSFPLARAYADQLERSRGLGADRLGAVRSALSAAEGQSGAARRDALMALATQLDADARGSSDQVKARMLATAVRDLANAQR